ncbi:hypothetical protein HI914_01212 [Erysiphe necator]|nr:hypothetical protein HI914_01212 [Erysiphe necator]
MMLAARKRLKRRKSDCNTKANGFQNSAMKTLTCPDELALSFREGIAPGKEWFKTFELACINDKDY